MKDFSPAHRLPRDIETEVLPAEETQFEHDEKFIRAIAKWMDTAFVVPGTNIRFGLDPLIGLLPGAGDAVDALISTFLLSRAARYGVPKLILVRMAVNVIINTLVGGLPVVGDAFSVWWKSNAMNYELLRKHALKQREVSSGDWVFVLGLIVAILLVMLLMGAAIVFVVSQLGAAFSK